MMYPFIKRGADVVLSLLALICLSPVYLLVALAVKLTSPGPVLFRQKRVGRGGRLFTIYKFRTMRTDTPRDTATHLLQDPSRYITRVGAFLRRSSLDELPQFFNVLKGDMSIVGPRPALYNQYDLIAAREKAGVNAVRPGITGLAPVSYTHLDVYKRQVDDSVVVKAPRPDACCRREPVAGSRPCLLYTSRCV